MIRFEQDPRAAIEQIICEEVRAVQYITVVLQHISTNTLEYNNEL